MTEWRALLDSACEICLWSTSHVFFACSGGLSRNGEVCFCGIFEAGIRNFSACSSRTRVYRDKQRARLDLAHQIGLETALEVSLIVG